MSSWVACNGERHELVFADGELRAVAHDDPAGERALSILGGTSCPCIDVLEAWARRRGDPSLLTVLGRGPSDLLDRVPATGRAAYAPLQQGRRPARSRFKGPTRAIARASMSSSAYRSAVSTSLATTGRPAGAPGQTLAEDAERLGGLGRMMTARLVGAVTESLLGRAHEAHIAAVLEASLYGRLLATARLWSEGDVDQLELRVVEPGDEGAANEASDADDARGLLRLALPLSWVADVWARDLALVAGCLVLRRLEQDGVELLDAVAPPEHAAPGATLVHLELSRRVPTARSGRRDRLGGGRGYDADAASHPHEP